MGQELLEGRSERRRGERQGHGGKEEHQIRGVSPQCIGVLRQSHTWLESIV